MTSLTYAGNTDDALTYTYDAMRHLTGLTESIIGSRASATYGTAGEMDSLNAEICPAGGGACGGFGQNFTYNGLWQLTGDGIAQYIYPAGRGSIRRTAAGPVGLLQEFPQWNFPRADGTFLLFPG